MKRRRRTSGLFRSPWVYVVVVVRLCGMLLILFSPLTGMAVSFILDWLDSLVLIQIVRYSRDEYHRMDKTLDQVWSLVMLAVGMTTPYWPILIFLYVYRLVGYLAHIVTGTTRVYLWFPNIFEFVFLWYVGIAPLLGEAPALIPPWQILAGCLVLKEGQEYLLHIWWPRQLARMKHTGYPPLLQALGWHRIG